MNYVGNDDRLVKDFSFGMSWDEGYLYTYITFEGGCDYTQEVWNGTCIQIGGTDYGTEEVNDRLEYGITWDTDNDCNRTILWNDYLNSEYANGTDTDDFAVFFRDGWVVYEIRTPFSAFSTDTEIAEGDKFGVCYVIANGDGRYAHTQIGWGITGMYGKNAGMHCPIRLTAAIEAEEWDSSGYDVLFVNIGNNWSDNVGWPYMSEDRDATLILTDEDTQNRMNVTGYDHIGYRVVYYNVAEDVVSRLYDRLLPVDTEITLNYELYDLSTDSEEKHIYLKDYAYKCEFDDLGTFDTIVLECVYEPKQYTIKFNNIGNVDSGENEHYGYCQSKVDMRFGDNIWDYLPDPEDTESWPYLMVTEDGDVFSHWRVLDFSKDYDDVNEKGERYYSDYWVDYTETDNPLKEDFIAYAVEGTEEDGNKENYPFITFRAVYESADTVYHSGTIGEDNIPWQITADGTLTVGTVDGEGSYSIPDWDDPWNGYNWDNEDEIDNAIANGKIAPWFPYRDEVTALVIGNDISYIGNHSFRDHENIAELTIPGNVKTIGEWAFHYNRFASITIEDGVESIENGAFNDSQCATSIHIPASVSYIDGGAFTRCYKVTEFTVDADNAWHTAEDGVLFTKAMETLIFYPCAKEDTSYIVPDTVTLLQSNCFLAAKNLTSIILPDGLETIQWWALAELNVTELVIPGSVNSVQDSAFRNDYNLTDIYFQGKKPDDWHSNQFWLYDEKNDCDYIKEDLKIHYNAAAENWGDADWGNGRLGDGWESHIVIDGGYAVRFVDDDGITELLDTQVMPLGSAIDIPNISNKYYGRFKNWFAWNRDYTMDVSYLTLTQNLLDEAGYDSNWDGINDTIVFQAEYSFYSNAPENRAEDDIVLDDGNVIHWWLTWDGTLCLGRLDDANENVELAIPDYGDENLPPWHEYNTYIHGLNLGENIVSIGNNAFRYLCALEGLNIPGNVKSIGADAFYIGANDFSEYFNNSSLQWIQLNDGLEHIGHNAFCNANVDNLWIPKTVTDIEEGAFFIFWNNRFEVDGNNPNYYNTDDGALYRKEEDGTSTLMAYPARQNGGAYIQEGTSRIADSAFTYRTEITTIYLPNGLKTIGEEAFSNTFNLIELHIPASVESIGEWAFHESKSNMVLYFYGDAPVIPDNVSFQDNFTICYIEGTNGWDDVKARFPHLNYDTFSASDNYAGDVIDYDWNDEHIHLNWYITKDGWLKVEGAGSIPDHEHPWWEYQAYVRGVDIDDRITYIGDSVFCNLTHVYTINLPSNVTYIGYSAFNADGSCGNSIGHLILPGKLEEIHNYAFGNLGITKVTIPVSLCYIESGWAFFDNPITTYAVEKGSINFGVDSYGALYELDDSGNYVALVAYPRDAEATSYTVPNGVKTLYGASIRNACNLTEVILPDTLEVIYNEALAHFYNGMRTLTIPASVKTIYSNAFRWGNKTSVVFLGDMPEFINDGEGEGNQFWDNLDNQITVYYYEGKTGWENYDPQDIHTYMLKAGEEPFAAQGYFWDNWDIQWTIDKNGVLNVYGSGEIPGDWGGYSWRDHMGEIKQIIIHEGITGIGEFMFYNISGVTNLKLPSTLTYIGQYAFASGYYDNTIGELVLPEGLERIDDFAFHRTGLTKVTIPSTLESIESHVFVRNQIKEFVVNEGNDCYSVDEYGVLFEKREHQDEDGNGRGEYFLRLHSYPAGSSMTSYTIPEKLNEMDVGEIGDWAFTNAQNLTKVELSNVWGICAGGFLHCNNITSLELTNMHWISPEAIFGCEKLTSIIIDGRIPEVFVWDDGYNMPFVNNGVNYENDGLVVYYYSDAENMERLDVLKENYTVVELTRSNLKGDVNGDGKVDEDDLTILQQYYAGYNVTIANKVNADIDGENGLTRRDVMILARYLDNWGDDYSKYFD